MMKTRILWIAAAILFLFSCSKDKSAEKPDDNGTTQQTFQPVTGGSAWHYKDATGMDGGFTLTATGRDTLIDGISYAVFDNKPDSSSNVIKAYFANEDNNYYMRSFLASMGDNPILYFKDSVDVKSTWAQQITINQPPIGELDCMINFTLEEINATKQVNGVSYKNTSEVDFTIVAGSLPVGSGTLLASRGIGIISLTVKMGVSTVANYVLESHNIKN